MDKEILDTYIDLKGSCLDETERKQVMEMLYEYKDVFSLRDEIRTCPNIEVNIEVTDNSPWFIRPYHVKEEDRVVLDKEMRMLCYLGILKEGLAILFLFLIGGLSHIENKLRKCQDSVQLVCKMEKNLYNDNIISICHPKTSNQCAKMDTFSNNSLIQVESTLLTIASIPSLYQEVLHMFPVILTDTIIVRYAFYNFLHIVTVMYY